MTPALRGLPVGEYAANLIKKSVVGTGHAEKAQVQMMMKMLLPTAEYKGADAADALAIAMCHAHHRAIRRLSVAGMIGKLKGLVDGFGDDFVHVDVNGVVYEVFCSAKTMAALPQVGHATVVHIETIVREDMIRLYGFATPKPRRPGSTR